MAPEGKSLKRGFLLGKFMPPHAGHVTLIQSGRALVDELTVLLCSQPDDPIPGELRFGWMQEIFPDCRVLRHCEAAPQQPSDDPQFWQIWSKIVSRYHPEPIDYLFAGESYGAQLAHHVGGTFVPLGGRILKADQGSIGGISASAVRDAPWSYWDFLPHPVRSHYGVTICLHGIESVGKSTLAERLAEHYRTTLVPEYGRSHCEVHGTDCREDDLMLIGEAQQAMINAARPWANRLLIADTDALMTAAWSQMMIGYTPDQLICHRKADLYLMLAHDAPFVDDGTRVYKTPDQRDRFHKVVRDTLVLSRANFVEIRGSWDERFMAAVAAIDELVDDRGFRAPKAA
ncbi:MAG TPA: AAA family ATPase [Sphingomicrobium sp.]|nr:AAA family ATPase [Sphingomicrobium sp.]